MSAPSQEKWLMFSKGVGKVFDNWTVLRLAVDYGWGGRESQQKKKSLIDYVISLFREGGIRVKVDKLSDLLFDRLLTNFSVEEQDDSAYEVAKLLVDMYNNCMKGDFSLCQQVESHGQAKVDECKGQDNVIAVVEGLSDFEDLSDLEDISDSCRRTSIPDTMEVEGT
eukprot:GHVS01104287.1.p1 GENE.GHVS01104287.1~~GHVS01104287.1.p1  ORF type:complete len:167 (+),score=27.69 GHVS01104287.1:179-679(+)